MSDRSSAQRGEERETIGAVLGRTPSGVFILTVSDGDGRETGMLASWVQQASFEPPAVTVAVNKQRYLNDWLARSPQMALSLIARSQGALVKHFARGFEPDQSAFEGLETSAGQTGLTVLKDALGYLEGTVTGQMETGDHVVYLLEITGAGASERLDELEPMIHVRKSGFRY